MGSLGIVIFGIMAFFPKGEGAFGIAKALPMIFFGGWLILFSLIWFPVVLTLFLKDRHKIKVPIPVVIFFSGTVFIIGLVVLGILGAGFLHDRAIVKREQGLEAITSQTHIELNTVKPVIDQYLKESHQGLNFQPPSGSYNAMLLLIRNPATPPEVLGYLADNLDNRSLCLGLIAEQTNCPSELFPRLSSLPQVQRYFVRNPHAPADYLRKMAQSEDVWSRLSVACNPNTPIDALELLTKDSRTRNREEAKKNLERKTAGGQTTQ